jgi:WD40 repeat protein
MVKVLDAGSGGVQVTLEMDTVKFGYYPAAISADARWVVFGSREGTLRLVDVITKQTHALVKGLGRISSVAFSPDGQRILSGSGDGSVHVWDAATGAEKLTLKRHAGGVTCLAMSADGQRIFSGGLDGTVRVWDVATGQAKLILKSLASRGFLEGGRISRLAISRDGRLIITGCGDGTVRVWEAPLPKPK